MSKFIQTNRGEKSQNYQAKQITINNNSENKEDNIDLKKKHPIAYISTFITGCVFTVTVIIPFIMHFANQEVVTRDSYVLLKDLEKEYISIDSYNELKDKIEIYENSLFEKDTKINELQKQSQYSQIKKLRDNIAHSPGNFQLNVAKGAEKESPIAKELYEIALENELIKEII